MRTRIYTLRTVSDKSTISFDLTGKIISETQHSIQINIDGALHYIDKFEYLNKMRVYDTGKVFFLVCGKNVSLDSAFHCLMAYAIKKLDARVEKLNFHKQKLLHELAAA